MTSTHDLDDHQDDGPTVADVVAQLLAEPDELHRAKAAREHARWLGRCGVDPLLAAEHRDALVAAKLTSRASFDEALRAGKADARRAKAERAEASRPMSSAPPERMKPLGGGDLLFDREIGLLARQAADIVMANGPLRFGVDGQFWCYSHGVWSSGEDEAHRRIADLLGDRYRPNHEKTIREVLRAYVPRIAADPVPRYINFTNGLLDWRTGTLVPHDPDIPTTVQLPVMWDPAATCPTFDAFIGEVIPTDDINRVWEVVGYLMMSGNPLHKLFMLTGSGRNGKGAFQRTVVALLGGRRNVAAVSLHSLSDNRFASAQLYGKIANIVGDIDATFIEDTGVIKELSGEDEILAEHKFGQPFSFTAWCSMLFSANEIPASADSSTGWTDRWEVLPFPNYIGDRVDTTLESRMQSPASLAGIAAKSVPALRALMERRRFETTDSAQSAKEDFARKSNPVLTWLHEQARVDPTAWTVRKHAYRNYRDWAQENGLKSPLSNPRFLERVRHVPGVGESKRQGTWGLSGLRLVEGHGAEL